MIQLCDRGLFVDTSGILYVADHYHRHVVGSPKVLLQDTVIVSIAPCDCNKRVIVENVYSIQYSSSLVTDSLLSCDFASWSSCSDIYVFMEQIRKNFNFNYLNISFCQGFPFSGISSKVSHTQLHRFHFLS